MESTRTGLTERGIDPEKVIDFCKELVASYSTENTEDSADDQFFEMALDIFYAGVTATVPNELSYAISSDQAVTIAANALDFEEPLYTVGGVLVELTDTDRITIARCLLNGEPYAIQIIPLDLEIPEGTEVLEFPDNL